MNLSAHFTLEELVASSTAERLEIDNTPPAEAAANLRHLAAALEVVRDLLGHPLHIDSGYRCPALNRAVNGAPTSAHVQGFAADFTCREFGTPLAIVEAIAAAGIGFDQCIQEGSWVHLSIDPRMRGEILTAHFGAGGTTYSKGA